MAAAAPTSPTPTTPSQASTSGSARKGRKRNKTYDVWEYFEKVEDGVGILLNRKCIACNQEFTGGTATGTLRNHLQKHGLLLAVDKGQRSFAAGSHVTLSTTPQERQRNFEQGICRWLISSQQSFSTVEHEDSIKMMLSINDGITVPSRHTIRRRISVMEEDCRAKVLSIIEASGSKVSLTADAWTSRVYKGYMTVTAHWIDRNWVLRSATLEFGRFITPHSGEAACEFLYEVIDMWELTKNLSSITTDNASDMCKGVEDLRKRLAALSPGQDGKEEGFHVRCVAHVINLAVKECMKDVQDRVAKIRSVLNSLRSSVKRRDIYKSVAVELNVQLELLSLDTETRWSSTFSMIKKAYIARRAINGVVGRVTELSGMVISEEEWHTASKVCRFLESAAIATESQSGTKYVTLSQASRIFEKMIKNCEETVKAGDKVLTPIEKKMLDKLRSYSAKIKCPIATLAKTLDPRLYNDIIGDVDLLRKHVTLPDPTPDFAEGSANDGKEENTDDFLSSKSMFMQVLDDNSLHDINQDEGKVSYVRATISADRGADPTAWWKTNESRFQTVAAKARDVLAIQASSVASENVFSDAGNLITNSRTCLSDESIRACMLLSSW